MSPGRARLKPLGRAGREAADATRAYCPRGDWRRAWRRPAAGRLDREPPGPGKRVRPGNHGPF